MKINYTEISIAFILLFMFRVNDLISMWFVNIGFPVLRYQELWFFLLPGLYILANANKNNRLLLPHIVPVLIFLLVFWFLETYIHETKDFKAWSDLPNRFYYLILSFYFLVNLSNRFFYQVLQVTIATMFLKIILIYSSFFEFLDIIGFTKLEMEGGRISGGINLNIVNDQVALAILLILFLLNKKVNSIKIANLNIHIKIIGLIMLPLIFLSASRGSFILLLSSVLIVYYKKFYRNKVVISVLLLLIITISGSFLWDYAIENINVINRIARTGQGKNNIIEEGRLLQIFASWDNFSENILFGVGYANAANNVYHGISRSNFQYTQLLATGGIILFIVYFNMVFRFFASSKERMINNPFLLASFVYILLLFIFRRPDFYLGVLAYFVYELKRNDLNKSYE
jgi:hypothetical protein